MEELSPRFEDTGEGYSVVYKGKRLYSDREPVKAVLKKLNNLSLMPNTLVFIPSPLLLYGIKELLAMLPEKSHLLCIEQDEELMAASLPYLDPELLNDPRLTLLRTSGPDKPAAFLENLGTHNFRRALYLPLSGGYRLNPSLYSDMFRRIEQYIREFWKNRMTLIHMTRLWMGNLFSNLPELSISRPLKDLSFTKPVFLAGAGESLEEYIPFLREYRQVFTLTCVDTAAPVLINTGLKPDYIFSLDSQWASVYDFIFNGEKDIPIICDLTASPSVIHQCKGPKYFFSSRFAEQSIFGRLDSSGLLPYSIPPLGSVAIAALYILTNLFKGPIFYTGIDFSYFPGKLHSRGAPSHTLSLLFLSRLNTAPFYGSFLKRPLLSQKDKNGSTCRTDLVMQGYADILSGFGKSGSNLFDLGRKGLPTGITSITKNEALRIAGGWMDLKKQESNSNSGRDLCVNTGSLHNFLIKEKEFLLSLQSEAELMLKEKIRSSKSYYDLLSLCDYVHIHFPDYHKDNNNTGSYPNRVIESSAAYIKQIDKVLSLSEGHR